MFSIMDSALYIIIQTTTEGTSLIFYGPSETAKWETVPAFSSETSICIKLKDRRFYRTYDGTRYQGLIPEVFNEVFDYITIQSTIDSNSANIEMYITRLLLSEKKLLCSKVVENFQNDKSFFVSTLEKELFSYSMQWNHLFTNVSSNETASTESTDTESAGSENTKKQDSQKVVIEVQHNSGVIFFFCYILPTILVFVLLLSFGLLLPFLFFMFICLFGCYEFKRGWLLSAKGYSSVDWCLLRLDQLDDDEGMPKLKLQSGVDDFDNFLGLIAPFIEMLFKVIFAYISMASRLVLKVLFSISCFFYNLITQNNKKNPLPKKEKMDHVFNGVILGVFIIMTIVFIFSFRSCKKEHNRNYNQTYSSSNNTGYYDYTD